MNVIIFPQYSTLPDDGFFTEAKTSHNKLYSKIPTNIVVTVCPYASVYNPLALYYLNT